MPERFTAAVFAPLVGQVFLAVPADGDPVELVLIECEQTRYGSPEQWEQAVQRVPFSLVFRAPDGPFVEQQTFTLHHRDLGEIPLFLVPLGPDDRGMLYQAVIS